MKKLILLIFVVAASLNAQAVQGQIGQVPVVAAADNSPVGGAGNLTTVGSVPYVSASGILNQDAGQFFWDATNNRLGIGTATPVSKLDITDTSNANLPIVSIRNTNGYQPQLNFDTYGYLGSPAAMFSVLNIIAAYAGAAGAYVQFNTKLQPQSTAVAAMTILGGGNVGIGTTSPGYALDVTGTINASTAYRIGGNLLSDASRNILIASIYDTALTNQLMTFGSSAVTVKNGISLTVGGTSTFYNSTASTGVTSVQVRAGANQGTTALQMFSDVSNIQLFSVESNGNIAGWINGQYTKAYEISSKNTNATNGGMALSTLSASTMTEVMRLTATLNVGIGTTTPGVKLDVLGSARVYDSTADAAILIGSDQVDANSAKISYNRGTANLDITPRSTYATNLVGKLKFSITNSTGANSVLLGANSPATITTAPYTWITVTTSDGTTGFMPIWK